MTPDQKPIKTSDKVYRLGILGRKGGGKTCLLAALGIRSGANRIGEPEVKRIKALDRVDTLPTNTPDPHPLMRFKRGSKWLEDAETLLQRGDSPQASNITYPASGLYRFGNGRGRNWLVEVVDYSGELLESNQPPKKIMATLRSYLQSLDGLLILVDAPSPNEQAQFDNKIRSIGEAFASLTAEAKKKRAHYDIPIALVFNKWDLRSQLAADTITIERELRDFLENSTEADAHRDFANQLFSLKRREDDERPDLEVLFSNLTQDDMRCFAVSAFGPSRQVDGRYLPVVSTPLKSFGIEAPFVWACERRDDADLAHFEERAKQRRWFNLFQWYDTWEILLQGFDLFRRFKSKTTKAARVRAAGWRVIRETAIMAAITGVLLIGAALGVEYKVDDSAYRQAQTVLDDPEVTDEQIREAETWLHDYYNSDWFRHMPYAVLQLPKLTAKEIMDAKRQDREKHAFSALEEAAKAGDLAVVLDLAIKYNEQFPNSSRRADVERVVAETKAKELKFRADTAFKAIADAFQAKEIETANSQARKFLEQFPDSVHVPDAERIIVSIEKDAQAKKELVTKSNEDELTSREELLGRISDLESARKAEAAIHQPLTYQLDADDKDKERLAKIKAAVLVIVKKHEEAEVAKAQQLAEEAAAKERLLAETEKEKARLHAEAEKEKARLYAETEQKKLRQIAEAAQAKAQREAEMAQREAEMAHQQAWETLRAEVRNKIDVHDYADAARKIEETTFKPANDEETESVDELKQEVGRNAIVFYKGRINTAAREDKWLDTHDKLNALRANQFFKNVASSKQVLALDNLQQELNKGWDQALWQKVLDSKLSRQAILEYRRAAPLKTMDNFAEDYLKYLAKNESKLDLTIVVTAKWGNNSSLYSFLNGVATFTINNGEPQVMETKVLNYKEGEVGNITCASKLSDTIKANILVMSGSHIVGKADDVEITIEDLKTGKTVSLEKYENALVFKLDADCLPVEPKMPGWREQ